MSSTKSDPTRHAEASGPADDSPYAVLRNRDFRLFLISRFVASFGQQMLTVAVGWELYERTGSALALGLVGLAQMVPMILFTLPAGHLADNLNRKQIIMAMTLLIAICSLGLTLVSALDAPTAWIYFCLFALSVSSVVNSFFLEAVTFSRACGSILLRAIVAA